MKLEAKQRIVKAALVVLALWPLAHVFVVRATGMSPWRGFGWGMYTVPVLSVDVGVRHLDGAAGGATEEAREAVLRELKRFIKHYQALGPMARPDRVADAVFAAYPGFERIEITARQNAIDRGTACVVEGEAESYIYRRNAGGGSR